MKISSTPTSAGSIAYVCIPIPAPESVAVSPNGRFVAALSGSFATVSIWNLGGNLVSRYPGQSALAVRWSPDSSRLLIWGDGQAAAALGVDASIATLHISAQEIFAAPGRQDVAVETNESGTPVVYDWSLTTGQTNLVARDARLLGWNLDGVIFARGLQVFMRKPGSAVTTQLATSQQPVTAAEVDSPTSPDGQALIVRYGENGSAVITNLGVRQLPQSAGPPLWVAPHSLIEYNQSAWLSLYDAVAGSNGAALAEASGVPQAVSGPWVAWQSGGEIGLTMMGTTTTPIASTAPVAGTISSLGGGAFLLHGSGLSFEFASQQVALPQAAECPPA